MFRFYRTIRSFYGSRVPSVLHTASEWLQNGMILRAMERSDMGETAREFVELWNERSRTSIAVIFARTIV